ncbi:MAG TPA: DUF2071 domain-containing protein [Terriglobales bacterium]
MYIGFDCMTAKPLTKRIFLKAQWRYLAMLNYEVDPRLLAPFVPSGTELDYWDNKTFISLIGFRFLNTKVFGIAFPFHRNFDEVNLRFYVRRQHGTEIRRGVVFIREVVPRKAVAAMAKMFYGEPYVALPMSHSLRTNINTHVTYQWKLNGRWNRISILAVGDPVLPENDSAEQFITEHYWGYAAPKAKKCVEYEVRHPQWRVWKAQEAGFEGCAEKLYGHELNALLQKEPASAFLAQGSEVSVFRGTIVTADETRV